MPQPHHVRGKDVTGMRIAHDAMKALIEKQEKALEELKRAEYFLGGHIAEAYGPRAKTLEEVLSEYRASGTAPREKDHVFTRLVICLKNDLLFDYCVEDMLATETRASLMRIPNFGAQSLAYLEAALAHAGISLTAWE